MDTYWSKGRYQRKGRRIASCTTHFGWKESLSEEPSFGRGEKGSLQRWETGGGGA